MSLEGCMAFLIEEEGEMASILVFVRKCCFPRSIWFAYQEGMVKGFCFCKDQFVFL